MYRLYFLFLLPVPTDHSSNTSTFTTRQCQCSWHGGTRRENLGSVPASGRRHPAVVLTVEFAASSSLDEDIIAVDDDAIQDSCLSAVDADASCKSSKKDDDSEIIQTAAENPRGPPPSTSTSLLILPLWCSRHNTSPMCSCCHASDRLSISYLTTLLRDRLMLNSGDRSICCVLRDVPDTICSRHVHFYSTTSLRNHQFCFMRSTTSLLTVYRSDGQAEPRYASETTLSVSRRPSSSSMLSDRCQSGRHSSHDKRQDWKALRMLSAILLAFIVTWSPYNLFTVIQTFCATCINPSLYAVGK